MGLKADVRRAMGSAAGASSSTRSTTEQPEKPPVQISGEAHHALTLKMREWSGWPKARLMLGTPPSESPHACTDHVDRVFTANPETLVINPNRVLLTVTPFRLKQEAVLTGTLLHEAGHARHTHWLPRTEEDMRLRPLLHSDGTPPTKQTVALARVMEEPRVEGLIARDADKIGATGLDWTMRASAAFLIPTTRLDLDPAQALMDLITSWALRAGRQIALSHWTNLRPRNWVGDFTQLLHQTMHLHIADQPHEDNEDGTPYDPKVDTLSAMALLVDMTKVTDDTGPTMIDKARDVLALLFPETDGDSDDAPMPSEPHSVQPEPEEQEDEPEDQPEDEPSAPSDDEEGDDEGEGQPEPDSPGDEAGEDEAGDEEGESDGESSTDGDDQPGEDGDAESDSDEGEGDEAGEGDGGATSSTDQPAEQSELEKALAEIEARSASDTEDEAEEKADEQPNTAGGMTAGTGEGGDGNLGWRNPTKDEREVQKGAERFLRDLIAPTESSKVSLTESPSATVDGAALAAWRAGGQQRDPRFFKRTRREVQPSPPVKIAVLVDVSGSMDELQKPSALLSWALASAALDLKNFAGRGQQVESTLIHWGSSARVIQHNGGVLPGIKEFGCYEGTSALAQAMMLAEQEIPDFFEITDKPVNRLIVQFTDWQMSPNSPRPWIQKALAAGVNMISVVPRDYSPRYGALSDILSTCTVQRGRSVLMKYNPVAPEQVWDEAAKMLGLV